MKKKKKETKNERKTALWWLKTLTSDSISVCGLIRVFTADCLESGGNDYPFGIPVQEFPFLF